MKKWVWLLIALLAIGPASAAMGEVLTLYEVVYDEQVLDGWYKSAYPFPETLLYANEDENQLAVFLLDKAEYPDAGAYMTEAYEAARMNMAASDFRGPSPWEDARFPNGVKASYIVRDDTGAYTENLYAADYDGYMMLAWFTMMGDSEEWAVQFADSFFADFAIVMAPVDERRTGYVRGARLTDGGEAELLIDYVRFEWGEDMFDYTIEDDGEGALAVMVDPAAKVYIPSSDYQSEPVRQEDAAGIVAAVERYLAVNREPLFEVAIRDGKLVWMDYCYVV